MRHTVVINRDTHVLLPVTITVLPVRSMCGRPGRGVDWFRQDWSISQAVWVLCGILGVVDSIVWGFRWLAGGCRTCGRLGGSESFVDMFSNDRL